MCWCHLIADTQTTRQTATVLVLSDSRHTNNHTKSNCIGVIRWQTHKHPHEKQMCWCHPMADTQTSTRKANVLVSSDGRHTNIHTKSKGVGVIRWQTQTSTRKANALVSSDGRHTNIHTKSKCVGVIRWQTHKHPHEKQMCWCHPMADTQTSTRKANVLVSSDGRHTNIHTKSKCVGVI